MLISKVLEDGTIIKNNDKEYHEYRERVLAKYRNYDIAFFYDKFDGESYFNAILDSDEDIFDEELEVVSQEGYLGTENSEAFEVVFGSFDV